MLSAAQVVTAQPHGWINNNLGWITLVAALLTAGVTIVYVVLTWKLVGVDRRATEEAKDANELSRNAITATQEANKIAQQALEGDRRQYVLAVRNRQDAAVPAVVIRFAGTAVHQVDPTSEMTFNVEDLPREEFDTFPLVIDSNFSVTNHGPGPALVWTEIDSKHESTYQRQQE
jgi:hypothetical protein